MVKYCLPNHYNAHPEAYEGQKYWGGGLSTTWLLGHGKAEGVGRGICSLPRRARRKFCWHMHKMETILYNKLMTIM